MHDMTQNDDFIPFTFWLCAQTHVQYFVWSATQQQKQTHVTEAKSEKVRAPLLGTCTQTLLLELIASETCAHKIYASVLI